MTKFRASFTVLNLWDQGDYDEAIKAYFKLERVKTRAMDEGSAKHDEWRRHVLATGCLPQEFGGAKLNNPSVENKNVIQLENWLDFVYIPDLVDGQTIYEFKTGVTTSQQYADSKQMGVYAVGLTFDKVFVNRGVVLHWNQYTRKADTSTVWLTDKVLRDAHHWIIGQSRAMFDYISQNGLFDKFNSNLLAGTSF